MAVRKAIIDIPVNDGNFNAFLARYTKYNTMLEKAPALQKNIGKETDATMKAIKLMTASMLANMDVVRKNEAAQAHIAQSSRISALSWSKIASSTKESAVNLRNQVSTLMKWTGISSAIGGLALGGSVGLMGLGLDRLAGSASAGRRSSSGLGLSYGQQSAFGVSFERMIDSAGFLGGVSQARGNITSGAARSLQILGMNPMGKGSTGDMSIEALTRIRKLAQSTPEEHLGILMQTHGLGELGMDVESLRRMKFGSDSEFDEYKNDYSRRSKSMEVGDPKLKKWQDFYTQLDEAGQKIKSGLIDGLVSLAEPLTKISQGLSDTVRALLGSNGFKEIMDNIAKGLDTFAKYVSKDEFKQDMMKFFEGVSLLAQKIWDLAKWIAKLFPSSGVDAGAKPTQPKTLRELRPDWFPAANDDSQVSFPGQTPKTPAGVRNRNASALQNFLQGLMPDRSRNPYDVRTLTQGSAGGTSTPEMEAYKKAIAKTESGGNYGALGPMVGNDRAHGKYQVMGANIPSWSQQALGVSMTPEEFLRNPKAQEKIFEHIFGGYVKKYGNAADAFSMWHSGVPLAQALREGRADVNMTTGAYVNKVLGDLNKTTVQINDNTGGAVNVVTSQMGPRK